MKNIKDIHISIEPSISPKGRLYRLSAIKKGSVEKWVNGILKFNWYYKFKYLDDNSYFTLSVDAFGNVLKKYEKTKCECETPLIRMSELAKEYCAICENDL